MTTARAAAAAIILAAGFPARAVESPPSFAGDAQATPIRIEAERISVGGIVEQINVEQRQLVLRTAEGHSAPLKVAPDVQGLEQLHRGDAVWVNLIQPVAVLLHRSDEPLTPSDSVTSVRLVPRGGQPGPELVGTQEVAGVVEGIDRDNHTVTIRSFNMDSVKLSVPADDPAFARLRLGDRVLSLYSEGLALAVSRS
jgi:hypothetical protein